MRTSQDEDWSEYAFNVVQFRDKPAAALMQISMERASENWDGFPSKTFERVQFPLRPAFAQTLTKAEGKTYERVGLLWSKEPTRVLHGELYLACSRVRHPKNLAICVPWHMEDLFKTPDEGDHYGLLMESLTEKPGLVNTVFHC